MYNKGIEVFMKKVLFMLSFFFTLSILASSNDNECFIVATTAAKDLSTQYLSPILEVDCSSNEISNVAFAIETMEEIINVKELKSINTARMKNLKWMKSDSIYVVMAFEVQAKSIATENKMTLTRLK